MSFHGGRPRPGRLATAVRSGITTIHTSNDADLRSSYLVDAAWSRPGLMGPWSDTA